MNEVLSFNRFRNLKSRPENETLQALSAVNEAHGRSRSRKAMTKGGSLSLQSGCDI